MGKKEMVYKSERAVDSGNITTFIVKGKDTATFRIVSFKMSDNYAETNNIRRVERSIEVSIFDAESLEWKEIVPVGTFRYGDCIEMQMDDCVNILVKVRDFMRDYFGINFSW